MSPPATRLMDGARRVLFSPRLPFEMRSRLFYWYRKRSWPTRHPQSFSEKLHYKMAYDRRPLLTVTTDKVAVRDYVTRAVGPEVLTRLIAVESDPARLDVEHFPAEFVVKPNHASGLAWIVSDRIASTIAPDDAAREAPGVITTARTGIDRRRLVETSRRWLATSYADVELEWGYRHIPRRIMVEELLVGAGGQIPQDYKLYVFNGGVRLIEVHTGRFGRHCCDLFRPDWSSVATQFAEPPADPTPSPPDSLERMLQIAETLGRETDFVRVDLYDIGGRVVFGELSSYPAGIDARYMFQESLDREIGTYWRLPRRYDAGEVAPT